MNRLRVVIDKDDLHRLASYASHYGNCSLDSWDKRLTRCDCGLFALLRKVKRLHALDEPKP